MKDVVSTIIVSLEGKTKESLLKSFEYSRRKNIKRADSCGLKFVRTESPEDLEEGYKIYSKTVLDGGTIPDEKEKWKEMVSPSQNQYFMVKYKDEIIGCCGLREITKRYFGLNSDEKGIRPTVFANKKEFNHMRPNDFIYWNTLLYALNGGYSFVDLGGYQLNPRDHLMGVNSFKEKWGGEKFLYYPEYPFHKAIGRKIIRNSKLFWWLNKKFSLIRYRRIQHNAP